MMTPRPALSSESKGGDARIRVRHREYVADLSGSVLFSTTSFPINPGMSQLFPWLSKIASRYESYLFRRLRFEFETQVSSATAGSVMFAVDYDSADSAPTTKQALMAYKGATRSVSWAPFVNSSDAQDLQKFGVQRYIRSGALASNLDIKTYDVGNLFVGVQGMAGAGVVGELYVDYEVELMTPELTQTVFQSNITSGGAVSRAAIFGTAAVITGNGDVSAANTNTLTFNRVGTYLVINVLTGTVFTNTSLVFTGTASTVDEAGAQFTNAAATSALDNTVVTVTAAGQTVIYDATGDSTTITASSTVVFRIA